jgi:hypothetical protein
VILFGLLIYYFYHEMFCYNGVLPKTFWCTWDDSLPRPKSLLIKTFLFNFSVFKIKNGQLVSYYQYLCFLKKIGYHFIVLKDKYLRILILGCRLLEYVTWSVYFLLIRFQIGSRAKVLDTAHGYFIFLDKINVTVWEY